MKLLQQCIVFKTQKQIDDDKKTHTKVGLGYNSVDIEKIRQDHKEGKHEGMLTEIAAPLLRKGHENPGTLKILTRQYKETVKELLTLQGINTEGIEIIGRAELKHQYVDKTGYFTHENNSDQQFVFFDDTAGTKTNGSYNYNGLPNVSFYHVQNTPGNIGLTTEKLETFNQNMVARFEEKQVDVARRKSEEAKQEAEKKSETVVSEDNVFMTQAEALEVKKGCDKANTNKRPTTLSIETTPPPVPARPATPQSVSDRRAATPPPVPARPATPQSVSDRPATLPRAAKPQSVSDRAATPPPVPAKKSSSKGTGGLKMDRQEENTQQVAPKRPLLPPRPPGRPAGMTHG